MIYQTKHLSQFIKNFQDLRNLESIDELPENLNKYIQFLENELNIPIVIVSVGPDRKETLFR